MFGKPACISPEKKQNLSALRIDEEQVATAHRPDSLIAATGLRALLLNDQEQRWHLLDTAKGKRVKGLEGRPYQTETQVVA